MTEGFDYRAMVHAASIGVVRRVLEVAAESGFPGEHHAYLTFATGFPGVELPATLRARHPETLTVVLQRQYWDLEVGEDEFSVALRFDGLLSRIRVPFAALTTFIDPSVPFGLDLATFGGGGREEGADEEPEPEPAAPPEPDDPAAQPGGTAESPTAGGEVLPFRPR